MYTIYSRRDCIFCTKAKGFMTDRKLKYKEIVLEPNSESYVAERDRLIGVTGQRTFPWIFEGDRFIGGYTELVKSEDF